MGQRVLLASSLRVCLILLLCTGVSSFLSGCTTEKQTPDHPRAIDSILNTVRQWLAAGREEQAMNYLDAAYGGIRKPGIGDLYRKYDCKRTYYFEKAQFNHAMLYVDSALHLLEDKAARQHYYREYIDVNLHKGDILLAQKHYYKAYQYYYTSKVAIESTEDSCVYKVAVGKFSGRLGTVSYRQSKYAEAVTWYKETLEKLYQCEKDFELFAAMQGTLDNVALSYTKLKMADSALRYYRLAQSFIVANESKYPGDTQFIAMARGIIYGNEGEAWLLKGDTGRAEALFLRSIAINSRKGYYNGDAHITRLKLAGVYLAQSKFNLLNSTLQEVEAGIHQMDYEEPRAQLMQLRLLYYSKLGRSDLAYEYLGKYLLLKDSIEYNKRQLAGADFNKEFQSLKQEYQLNFMGEKDKRNTIYLLLTIIVASMIMALLLLIYYSLRQSRRNEQRINLQNEQLEATSEALAVSNRDYARIMKIVAHDLKNPVGAINGICSFLLSKNYSPSREKEMLELMHTSSQHSLEVIDDLLEVNFNQDQRILKKEPVDLGLLLQQCVDLLRFKARNKQQQIIVNADMGMMVKADHGKIWRVVNNLVVNAIKFSPTGNKIQVLMERTDGFIRVCVRDNGMGIPDALKDKVFDMFTEARRTGTSGEQPYGLGLCVNRQLIEAHGGRLWFESVPDVETSFYFTLPVP